MKNNLTEHVQSLSKEFDEKFPPETTKDIGIYDGDGETLDGNPRCNINYEIKSHLLLSQLKTIELLKEEIGKLKSTQIGDYINSTEGGDVPRDEIEKEEIYNRGITQAITLLDTIIQEIKTQVK